MITFHLASIQDQLDQAYLGLALAVAARRPFILPKVRSRRGRAAVYVLELWGGRAVP
jgi:hypothetical protein